MSEKRKEGEIAVGDRTVKIYELTVRDIKHLYEMGVNLQDISLSNFTAILDEFLGRCSNIRMSDVEKMDMAPSQIHAIYDRFMEINSDFFWIARGVGLSEMASRIGAEMRRALSSDLIRLLAERSATGTETSGTTDGGSSKPLSKKSTTENGAKSS